MAIVETVSENLPRLHIYEQLNNDPILVSSLINIYTAIIEASVCIYKYLDYKRTAKFFSIMGTSLDTELKGHLIRLRNVTRAAEKSAEATEMLRASQFRAEQAQKALEDFRIKISEWLRPPNMKSVQEHNIQQILTGTCQWVWSATQVVAWRSATEKRDSSVERLLLVSGVPGCGKSILASAMVQALQAEKHKVLYFSFSSLDSTRRTHEQMIRSFLWQRLADASSDDSIEIIRKLMLQSHATSSELWNTFLQITDRVCDESDFWIIDGLDECKDDNRKLLKLVKDRVANNHNTGIAIFGRPSSFPPDQTAAIMEISPEMTTIDIDHYIRTEVSKSTVLNSSAIRPLALQKLQASSNGMFLWVKFMINDLNKPASVNVVKERLHCLPNGLKETYRQLLLSLLEELDDIDKRTTKTLLSLIIAARRPLRVEELHHAQAIAAWMNSKSSEPFQFEEYSVPDFNMQLLSLCKNLVYISNGQVHLVHSSTKEFLTRADSEWAHSSDQLISCLRVSHAESQHLLCRICLHCIEMEDLPTNINSEQELPVIVGQYPLFDYAFRGLVYHVVQSEPRPPELVEDILRFGSSEKTLDWTEYFVAQIVLGNMDIEVYEFEDFYEGIRKSWDGKRLLELFQRTLDFGLADRGAKFGQDDWRTDTWRLARPYFKMNRPGGENDKDDNDDDDIDVDGDDKDNDNEDGAKSHNGSEDKNDGSNGNDIKNGGGKHSNVKPGANRTAIISVAGSKSSASRSRIRQLTKMVTRDEASSFPVAAYVHMLFGLRHSLRKFTAITDPLELLFRAILGKINSVPLPILLEIARFYSRVHKEEKAKEVLVAAVQRSQPDSTWGGLIRLELAEIYTDQEKWKEGEELLLEFISNWRKQDDTNMINACSFLDTCLHEQGKDEKAMKMLENLLSNIEKTLGLENETVLEMSSLLGIRYSSLDEDDKAEKMLLRGLTAWETNSTKWRMTDSARELGLVYYESERYEDAKIMFERAVKGWEETLGPEDGWTCDAVFSLGKTFSALLDVPKAEELYQRALKGWEKFLEAGNDDPTHAAAVMTDIGDAYCWLRRYDDAADMYQRALKTRGSLEPTKSILSVMHALGTIYEDDLDRSDDAIQMYEQALRGREKLIGFNHDDTLNTALRLAYLYDDLDIDDKAEEQYMRILHFQEDKFGFNDLRTLRTVEKLGCLSHKRNKDDEAEEWHLRVLREREPQLGTIHPATVGAIITLGDFYMDIDRYDRAEETFLRILLPGRDDPDDDIIDALSALGEIYEYKREYEKAEEMYRRAVDAWKELHGAWMGSSFAESGLRRVLDAIEEAYGGVKESEGDQENQIRRGICPQPPVQPL